MRTPPWVLIAGGIVLGAAAVVLAGHAMGRAPSSYAIAPELRPYVDSHTVPPKVKAWSLCPSPPVWPLVMSNPQQYRGRCVYVAGYLSPSNAVQTSPFRLDLPDPSAVGDADRALAISDMARGQMENAARDARPIPSDQPTGSVWIEVGPTMGPSGFWAAVDQRYAVSVLGTLEGTQNGLPLINGDFLYYYLKAGAPTPAP